MTIQCRKCGALLDLVEDPPGSVSVAQMDGWYFTVDTRWLCPTCAPSEDRWGEDEDDVLPVCTQMMKDRRCVLPNGHRGEHRSRVEL